VPRRRGLTGGRLAALASGLSLLGSVVALAGVPTPLLDGLGLARPTERLEAPGFTLPGLDGRPVALAAFRGRAVLLYFWATW
jgi:cytochrome oxidase Cu insertion factor (SCO1/SenC/PrrC family)